MVCGEHRVARGIEGGALHLRQRQGSRPQPAEDRDLVPGLVYPAIAIQTFRQRQGGSGGAILPNELGSRLRAESVELRLARWGSELQHCQSGRTVGDIGEQRSVGRRDDDVAYVAQAATRIEQLMKAHLFRLLDVDDRQPLATRSYRRARSSQIDPLRVG